MPWKGVTIMDQRVRFISEYLEGYFSIAELCRQFNVSRKTGYKWIGRYEDYGTRGLEDLSSKPHSCPHKTHFRVVRVIKMARSETITGRPLLVTYLAAQISNSVRKTKHHPCCSVAASFSSNSFDLISNFACTVSSSANSDSIFDFEA